MPEVPTTPTLDRELSAVEQEHLDFVTEIQERYTLLEQGDEAAALDGFYFMDEDLDPIDVLREMAAQVGIS